MYSLNVAQPNESLQIAADGRVVDIEFLRQLLNAGVVDRPQGVQYVNVTSMQDVP